ncbi:1-phosphatidylinositol phosphodiesterase [Ceratocystis lukuohia]|uniref:1-phosphatidylinositol phosphodiesterase n=1 Tax=Ceratocystis lukuohia TaxID=2019550 RepID=A0ABR4MAD2_9PEZI
MRFSLLVALACLAVSHAAEYQGIRDVWSFDVGHGRDSDWMDRIADDTPLSSLSIPGTHNSMTYYLHKSWTHTQNVLLSEQLRGGIRYIDITCKYKDGDIQVYHGHSDTVLNLGYVLKTMFAFLDAHPRETILLRIQRGDHSKDFMERFDKYFVPGSELGNRADERVYSKDGGITAAPILGELRGKVFILQDFKTERPGRYGLPWNSNTVDNYNHKVSAGRLFINSKWKGVKSHLSKAPSPDSNRLRITHTTASVGVSPINIAAKNNPDVGMNGLLGQYLQNRDNVCFGIIAMDFPGRHLVDNIISLNNKRRVSKRTSLVSDSTDTVPVEAGNHA